MYVHSQKRVRHFLVNCDGRKNVRDKTLISYEITARYTQYSCMHAYAHVHKNWLLVRFLVLLFGKIKHEKKNGYIGGTNTSTKNRWQWCFRLTKCGTAQ